MSLRKFKLKVGDQASYTDPETGIEHHNCKVLEVKRSKAIVRNNHGFPVEVSRRELKPPTHGDASMISGLGRISTGPKPKARGGLWHVR
jgi:hypothetical protein